MKMVTLTYLLLAYVCRASVRFFGTARYEGGEAYEKAQRTCGEFLNGILQGTLEPGVRAFKELNVQIERLTASPTLQIKVAAGHLLQLHEGAFLIYDEDKGNGEYSRSLFFLNSGARAISQGFLEIHAYLLQCIGNMLMPNPPPYTRLYYVDWNDQDVRITSLSKPFANTPDPFSALACDSLSWSTSMQLSEACQYCSFAGRCPMFLEKVRETESEMLSTPLQSMPEKQLSESLAVVKSCADCFDLLRDECLVRVAAGKTIPQWEVRTSAGSRSLALPDTLGKDLWGHSMFEILVANSKVGLEGAEKEMVDALKAKYPEKSKKELAGAVKNWLQSMAKKAPDRRVLVRSTASS